MSKRALFRTGLFVTITTCASATAVAQQLGRGDDDGIALWRVFAGVAVVLILGGAALVFGKSRAIDLRLWTPVASRRIKVIETVRISPQSSLCLAAFDGREYLIALTPGSATVVETNAAAADA
jgi:hypothetical protein